MAKKFKIGTLLISLLCILMNSQALPKNSFYEFILPKDLPSRHEPSDNPTTVYGVKLGEKLFFDTQISRNNTISCSSCHIQDCAFAEGKRFSSGIHDSILNRNSMPLFNLAWVEKYFWDGRADKLESAVMFPILAHNEMSCDTVMLIKNLNADKEYKNYLSVAFGVNEFTMDFVRKSLAQYLRSLTSYNTTIDNSYYDASTYMKQGHSQEEAVRHLFGLSQRTTQVLSLCEKCHSTITYGNNKMKNNGLSMEYTDKGLYNITKLSGDEGVFKVPSFRNVFFTAPYMHDGRFSSLEEVIEHYNSGIQPYKNLDPILKDSLGNPIRLNLTELEKNELITFFKLLSDTNFINKKN